MLHGSGLDDLMQLSHRASELLHNIFNSEIILKAQAHGNNKRKLHTSLHKQTAPEMAEHLCFFKFKKENVSLLLIEKLIKQKDNLPNRYQDLWKERTNLC